jgi:hypothetical protein
VRAGAAKLRGLRPYRVTGGTGCSVALVRLELYPCLEQTGTPCGAARELAPLLECAAKPALCPHKISYIS